MNRLGPLTTLCFIKKLCVTRLTDGVRFGIRQHLVSDSTNRFCTGSVMEFSGGESGDGVKPEEKSEFPSQPITIPLTGNFPVKTLFDTADHMLFHPLPPSHPLEVFLFVFRTLCFHHLVLLFSLYCTSSSYSALKSQNAVTEVHIWSKLS